MTDAKTLDVHEALDEVRAQKERLEEEIRTKTDLFNNLRKAQNELVTKFQEAKLQSEKQALELNAKSEELSTLSQLHQDLKSSFQEKESSLRHLNSAIEKLRHEYGEKIQKLEGENKELILALDEATAISRSLKSQVNASNMEIEDLKRILLLKDRKQLETADKAQTTKDLTQRDEVICKLEEKYRDVEDQLKWKNEQFQHLEEAHERLQDNFRYSKAEWEREKSLMLEEICSLQTSLDSQTRISENLQTQLKICNQALAHEESTRKLLEVEVSEYKLRFENIFSECHEAKATIEKLSHMRDEEVAELRDTLATKDSQTKEMGYKMACLEQENHDLTASLKEFQESQIIDCGTTGSLKKLQKKYQGLEQLRKKCTENLKEKEVEWKSQIEKVRKEMDAYLSQLKVQSEQVKQLQEELESCHFLSEIQNEEMSIVVLLLKSKISAACSELFTAVSKLELHNKESEEMILHLTEQLEIKSNALCEVNVNLSKKCEEVASLMKRVESIEDMKQHQLLMEEELQRHKKMLAESSENQILLEEPIRVLENSTKQDDKDGSDALSQKFVELEKRKLLAESQNMQLETSLEACKTENQRLLCQANEKNEKIVDLQQQLVLLETLVAERTETIEAQNQDKEKYFKVIEDKEQSIENLVVVSEQEKKSFLRAIEERNQRIEELGEEAKALEKEMVNVLKSSEEKQMEIDVIYQTLHKLEIEVSDVSEKLKVKDECLLQSSQHAEELEALLQINKFENEKLKGQFGDEKIRLESLVKKLEVQNQGLHEDIKKLSSDREHLEIQMETTSKQIDGFCKDAKLMEMLENMLQKSKSTEGIVNLPFSPLQDDARLPLVDLNK